MNNNFTLQQKSRTCNLDSDLIPRQNKLNLMADFLRLKYENPKLKQSEKAKQLCHSTSTLQRYSNDINVLSPHRDRSDNTDKHQKRLQILFLTTIHITILTSKHLK